MRHSSVRGALSKRPNDMIETLLGIRIYVGEYLTSQAVRVDL